MKSLKNLLFTTFLCSHAIAYSDNNQANNIENLLIKSLYEISEGELSNALITIDEIIKQKPNFKLIEGLLITLGFLNCFHFSKSIPLLFLKLSE